MNQRACMVRAALPLRRCPHIAPITAAICIVTKNSPARGQTRLQSKTPKVTMPITTWVAPKVFLYCSHMVEPSWWAPGFVCVPFFTHDVVRGRSDDCLSVDLAYTGS